MSPSLRPLAAAAVAAGFALVAAPAAAQLPVEGRAAVLDQLVRCRAIAAAAERLACFDAAASALDAAERAGDVVVVDREQMRQTRQRLFGLSLPDVPIFERGERPEQVDSIETTLVSARQRPLGDWIFELADGSVWEQIDNERINTSTRPGVPVRIRRAAMGSFLLSVNGARSVRASRVR